MIRQLLFLLLIHLPTVLTLDCHCSDCGENTKYCTGDYCYVKRYWSDRIQTGCITPREDVWKDEKLPFCEKNQYNATLCMCNSDNCNTDETFSEIMATGNFFVPDLIECVNNRSDAFFAEPACQSSFCALYDERYYDEFFDLTRPPFSKVDLVCPTDEETFTFRIDIHHVSPQMNSCLHIRWSPTGSQLTCFCNKPMCNNIMPMFNVTKRGKGKCYLKTRDTQTTTCWGDYCFWQGAETRGCVDAAGADPDFRLRLGESTYDEDYITICEGDYCNSDILFPNGTIVGPSAIRKFGTSFANSISLASLLQLILAKLLMTRAYENLYPSCPSSLLMPPSLRSTCLLIAISSLPLVNASGVCFIPTSSSIRRQVIDVQSTTTQVGCTILCLNNTNCQVCIFNATTNRCVMLSGPDPTAADLCPAPYTSLVRTTSNCPVLPSFPVDLDYSPDACSTSANVVAPPITLQKPACGSFPTGNRKIVFDAILHDGSHMILESHSNSFIQWDADLGSWYFSLNGLVIYFKCGTCVRPPATQSGACVCPPFPVETALVGYNTPTAPAIDSAPACPGMVQQHYKRVRGTGGVAQDVLNSQGRSVYCAMGEWMLLIDTAFFYNQYTVLAATCVVADAG